MRPRYLVGLGLSVVVGGIAFLAQVRVEAGCNAIPPVARRYPSTLGLVNRRLVAPWTAPKANATPGPDDIVEIELPKPCVSGTPFGAGLSIEIQFQRPVPGATASPSWMNRPGTHLVQFTVPETGRAGPVKIIVKDAAQTKVAEIGPLYQDTLSCNPGPPDETFGELTVLPVANDVTALAAGKAPLIMTVDAKGGLLIPLAHPFPVPTSQALGAIDLVAVLERGAGDFDALSVPMRTLRAALKHAQPPGDETLSRQLVRSFTEHGRPLPVLVHVDKEGAVWGSVDVGRSVLRVAPRDAASNPLQDLASRLDPEGRVVVTPRPGASPQPWVAATSAPFLLPDLRGRDAVVAFVRDERIEGEFDGYLGLDGNRVQTVHAERAGRTGGYELSRVVRDSATGRALIGTTDVGGAFLGPGIGDRAELVAYGLTTTGAPNPSRTPADLRSKLNRRGFALSSPLVFFGKYQTFAKAKLQSFDLSTATFMDAGVAPFDIAAVGTGCSVSLAAGTRTASWHCRDGGSQNGAFGVTADAVAIAGRLAVVAARPSPSPAVLLQAIRPTGNPGPLYRIAEAATAIGATAYCNKTGTPCDDAPCANNERCLPAAIFLAAMPSASPSPGVGMLKWVAQPSPPATPAPVAVQAASDFVAHGGIVAFRSLRTSGTGRELFTLDLRERPPRLCSTGSTATTPGAVDWDEFYEIRGDEVLFLTKESEEGRDLDGDRVITNNIVLQMFNVKGCKDPNLLSTMPAAAAPSLGTVLGSAEMESGGIRLSGAGATSTLFADEEGDGVVYPFDTCAYVANPRQIDDDLDALGDGAETCDPTYCTPYQPPPVGRGSFAERRCRRRIRDAAGEYFVDRARMVDLCLPTVVSPSTEEGKEQAGDVRCRGTFAHLTENRPTIVRSALDPSHVEQLAPDLVTAVKQLVRDEARFRDIAEDACADPFLASRVVRANAEAVAAISRTAVAVGSASSPIRSAAMRYVADAATIMSKCLDRCRLFPTSGTTLATQCLGHLAGGPGEVTFVEPRDTRTRKDLAEARGQLLSALQHADCAPNRCAVALACVGWRRAVDVVLASHPPH